MVVLALMGLMVGVVAVSLRGFDKHIRLQDAMGLIRGADQGMRRDARRLDQPMSLNVDIERQKLTWGAPEDAQEKTIGYLAVPSSMRIQQMVALTDDGAQDVVAITCNGRGLSASYALRLTNAGGTDACWLFFSGLSGQATVLSDTTDVTSLLERLRRADTSPITASLP